MAGYSIVLNLTGNSVTQSERLADNLWRAQANASRLATNLGAVSTALRSMPTMRGISPAQIRATGAANAQVSKATIAANAKAAVEMDKAAAKNLVAAERMNTAATKNVASSRGHSRKGSQPYISTGFNGPFGRVGRVFTFGDDEKLLGMNANKLLKGVNIAAIATSMVASIGKAVLKVMATATIAPYVVAGGGIMMALKYLQSESFAEGTRLISRRHQAKLGLGEDYAQAEYNTDFLAASYGFDRSTTLSSINTLTGLSIGGGKYKMNVGEATGLTKVGGLISQHHGVPFERVMTNIQQLLVQSTPHMRDIRELLNQAPILGKYAIRDMEEKGIKGVDVRTYLKDQQNILTALKRYELDVATNAGMQARGRIGLAQQDFHAKLAGNDPFWTYVGRAGSGIINAGGDAINQILTTLSENTEFKVMVKQIEKTFENLSKGVDKWLPILTKLVERIAEKLGVDLGDRDKSVSETSRETTVTALSKYPQMQALVEKRLEEAGMLRLMPKGETLTDEVLTARGIKPENFATMRQSADELRAKEVNSKMRDYINVLMDDEDFMNSIQSLGPKFLRNGEYTRGVRETQNSQAVRDAIRLNNTMVNPDSTFVHFFQEADTKEETKWVSTSTQGFYSSPRTGTIKRVTSQVPTIGNERFLPQYAYTKGELRNAIHEAPAMQIEINEADRVLMKFIEALTKVGTFDPDAIPKGDGGAGDDLTGFNRDRKALEIHFHAPIVEWNSTIQAANPQETVDVIAQDVEQLMSAGMQKALLGASNKMSSRWY